MLPLVETKAKRSSRERGTEICIQRRKIFYKNQTLSRFFLMKNEGFEVLKTEEKN